MIEDNEVLERNRLFSAMNGGTPYKSYRKTTLGKVYVSLWDSFSESTRWIITYR